MQNERSRVSKVKVALLISIISPQYIKLMYQILTEEKGEVESEDTLWIGLLYG